MKVIFWKASLITCDAMHISDLILKIAPKAKNNKGVISSGRTGSNTWIKHDRDEITKKVSKRIAMIVGMPLENAEAFQVIRKLEI